MRSLIIRWALLIDWTLMHITPELRVAPEARLWCHRNRDLDTVAEAFTGSTKPCSWLIAGRYGRADELWRIVGAPTLGFEEFVRQLTTGS